MVTEQPHDVGRALSPTLRLIAAPQTGPRMVELRYEVNRNRITNHSPVDRPGVP
jgi:hypothetical protein